MHKDMDITLDGLSKIEGHAELDIKVRGGKVVSARLGISENKRFFTQAIRGQDYRALPQKVSRICGTCSIAHQMACLEAIENALGIVPTTQTMTLRNLAMYGLMIRDHALHLYLFCLPDIYGKDSVLEFDGPLHELVHDAFDVKAVGNALSTLVAGRAVHPPLPQVGGFTRFPEESSVKEVIRQLKSIRPKALKLIDIFQKSDFKFEHDVKFVGLVNKDYNFLEGEIQSSDGLCIPESMFWEHLNRVVIPYSQATAFHFQGANYVVGALSRVNLNKDSLHPDTKKDAATALAAFPSKNLYHNNLAQAIELLHSVDRSIDILSNTDFKAEPLVQPASRNNQVTGVGVIEAPRGTLYYMLDMNKQGKVIYGNLVIPTAQNQMTMEKDIRKLVPTILHLPREGIEHEIEKLIRAYDPCMSCASHFLKVKWR
ncbi:MAG: nickel-dependent hydrogenase large subunit [Candidatus Aenigmatarchaeota archaeon]